MSSNFNNSILSMRSFAPEEERHLVIDVWVWQVRRCSHLFINVQPEDIVNGH
jgi:hypothetical protein